jgi:hypothetical protein
MGMAGSERRGLVRCGMTRPDRVRQERYGAVRRDTARHGMTRQNWVYGNEKIKIRRIII